MEDQFYSIKRVCVDGDPKCLPAYWVESTAPLNVEDAEKASKKAVGGNAHPGLRLEAVDQDKAIGRIVDDLNVQDPEIVIAIHGFNNPTAVALKRFAEAYQYANGKSSIRERRPVCIGYHWPSEKLGKPFPSSLRAAPGLVFGLLICPAIAATLLLGLVAPRWRLAFDFRMIAYLIGLMLVSLPIATMVFRSMSYFRDQYRAMHYGVPDLIEFIRDIEKQLRKAGVRRRVTLSFIGHSMGGFVVTNLVRVLSDVFNLGEPPESVPSGADARDMRVGSEIGSTLVLGRMVLVSPDIPAETLMTHRANFLGPSLRRFQEAYLFSNAGDVVVGMVSAVANHFSFPTSSRKNGCRLANVEIVHPTKPSKIRSGHGILNLDRLHNNEPVQSFLGRLRVGDMTLDRLDKVIGHGTFPPNDEDRVPVLPERFTYIDCTDYTERGKSYLTRGKCLPRLHWYNRLSLLVSYVLGRPDVHSGYFDGPTTRSMIYDLACLGFDGFLDSRGPTSGVCNTLRRLQGLDEDCRKVRVKMLLSPALLNALRPRVESEVEPSARA
jgi:esterase/lipase superfamily enzyme